VLRFASSMFTSVVISLIQKRYWVEFMASRSLPWHFRASRFRMCRVRTPPQENFVPSLIRSKIASSPSRLMTVRLVRSITSLRPSKFRLAFFQTVRSSATQGSMSLPSTTSLRRDRVSMMETLNMLPLASNQVKATLVPNPDAQGLAQTAETI
jgi:hypothetical protein